MHFETTETKTPLNKYFYKNKLLGKFKNIGFNVSSYTHFLQKHVQYIEFKM